MAQRTMRILSMIIFGVIVLFLSLVFAVQAKDGETPSKATKMVKVMVGEHEFVATLEDNLTAVAFLKKLPLAIQMNDVNSNEKCYNFPERMPVNAINPKKIQSGDLMLYGSSTLVLFYESFATPYSYTRVGKINNTSKLKTALGRGNSTVTFEIIESPIKSDD